MLNPHLFLKPTRETTRLYLTLGGRELLRAVLPPPSPCFHPRSAPTLLEGLALWLRSPLSVVLCAADEDDSFALGLSDGLGYGQPSVHYDVEVVNPAQRVRGLGSFADLRRLRLRGVR
jgi:hypothetical protein